MLGLLSKKERWGLTFRGWIVSLILFAVISAATMLFVHPFLAPTRRVPARLLVVEGWSPPSTMKAVASEFKTGAYDRVILVRPILAGVDDYESGKNYGSWLSQLLLSYGVPQTNLVTIFPDVSFKDRTYHSALVVRDWLAERGVSQKGLNLATTGPHARRSRLLYQKAFGDSTEIGVIALPAPGYDPSRWWKTSQGVREVIGESIAYLYARFIFPQASRD